MFYINSLHLCKISGTMIMQMIQVFWDVTSHWGYTPVCGSSHEPQNSGFKPFMITHFSTIVLTFWTGSNKMGCDHAASKLASQPSCHRRQLSQTPPFIKWGHYFCALRNASSFNHFMYSVLPEFIHILLKVNSDAFLFCEVILHCYYQYISSSSNQIGFFHWKWNLMSMMVFTGSN